MKLNFETETGGPRARFRENDDLPLWRAPAVKKKPPFLKGTLSWSSMRASIHRNLKTSAWAFQVSFKKFKTASSSGGSAHGGRKEILGENGSSKTRATTTTRKCGFKTTNEFTWKAKYFSPGCRQNSMRGMQLAVTVTLGLICCL